MFDRLTPRILCIDDEASVGEFLQSFLERAGDLRVEIETKAVDAMKHARTFRPDLLLLDIGMPRMDGFALARELRLEAGLRHKPIIFFTGMDNVEESVRKIWRTGPTECLRKGMELPVIEETVRRVLAERIALHQLSLKRR